MIRPYQTQMRFYDNYEQKINTWCFLILSVTIIWTFFFREWDDPSKHKHDHLAQRALTLAIMDQREPADTTVKSISSLLIKFSDAYNVPVDSIADWVSVTRKALENKELKKGNLKKVILPKKINNLEFLRMIDKIDDKKLPKVPDAFKVRMGLAIMFLSLKQVSG